MAKTINNYLNNNRNIILLFILLTIFLIKFPPILNSDIQPWDEGMYATRVLAIEKFGDFIDQSKHSVGGFYSASHPPLLIWIGYFLGKIFGINSITLKTIILIFSILTLFYLFKLSEELFNSTVGFFAILIFSSNIIFNVFSKRFQFDLPYSFFIVTSFYYFFKYIKTNKQFFNVLAGILFGLCLMIKILVGFYIPIIIFFFFIFSKKEINYQIRDFLILILSGLLIAAPWHIYMIINYGNDFLQYFLFYHIFERAFLGVEHNIKGSGIFYFINYYFSIIPFGIITIILIIKNIFKFDKIRYELKFIIFWFIIGLTIISLFRTKLEVYILLILTPASILIPYYLSTFDEQSKKEKNLTIILTLLNILWSLTFLIRNNPELKIFFQSKILFFSFLLFLSITILITISYFLTRIKNLKNIYYIFIIFFSLAININFLINIPEWENNYRISNIKNIISESKRDKIIYIGTNYRYNPQFSFYFEGLNIGWVNEKYKFILIDTKIGYENVKNFLNKPGNLNSNIIVEADNINRTEYPDDNLFIPNNFKLVTKTPGYKLYQF